MKETLKLISVLTIIALLSGVLMALVNSITAAPIREAQEQEQREAILAVLPPVDNDPTQTTLTIREDDAEWTFYVGRKAGQFVGVAFQTSTMGYGGKIRAMMGIDAKDDVTGVVILSHSETPGLGARITEKSFRSQFAGKSIKNTMWKVKKDGGDIDEITAATISSRAMVGAVRKGVDVFRKHRNQIVSESAADAAKTSVKGDAS